MIAGSENWSNGPKISKIGQLMQNFIFQGRRRRYGRSGHGRTTFLAKEGFSRTTSLAEYTFLGGS